MEIGTFNGSRLPADPCPCRADGAIETGHQNKKRWWSTVSCAVVSMLLLTALVPRVIADPDVPFCRSLDGKTSELLERELLIQPTKMGTVAGLIEFLRDEHRIPISFVQAQPEEPLTFATKTMSLDDLLMLLAEQHPGYVCELRGGRLILRSGEPIFDVVVDDVDLVGTYRFAALNDYIRHLQAFDERFAEWTRPLVGGNLESPLVTEKVTLAPRAPMLTHLVQLLGKLDTTYFSIPAPGTRPRTIEIAEVR